MATESSTTTTDVPLSISLMDMVFGYMLSRTVYAVAKLGIADLLADGPKTSAELAQATGTHAPSLYRLLRALASRGIFEESAEGCFGLTSNAALLRSDIFGSLRAHAIMYGEEQFQAWDEILYCIRTGQPGFDIIYGKGMYEYLAEHPDAAMTFNTAMGNSTVVLVEEILRAYDFSGFSIIVDVAGNQGQQLAAILRANPGSRGILFDQPYVVLGATQVLEQAGVLDRCEIVGGDFFTSVPNSGDVYIIKNALLAYNDDRASEILQTCRRAMKQGAKLLVMERLVPSGSAPSQSKFMDLSLLVTVGGRSRTETEFRGLLATSGLNLTKVVPIQSGSSVLECVPA